MKTRHKIAAAKLAYGALHVLRKAAGADNNVTVTRRGIRYALDLAEGIDLAIYLQGQFEPMTARACTRLAKRGQTVLDIGANIGAHTMHLAHLVGDEGRVLAFEPTDYAFTKLSRNLSLNPDLAGWVALFQCFLGASAAEKPGSIYARWPLVESAALHPLHGGAAVSTDGAASAQLDDILATQGNPTIHLVKMDVDGYECDVLSGARRMMERDRPAFVMELAPYVLAERGTSLAALLDFFIPLRYRFYRESDDTPLPMVPSEIEALIQVGESINVVAKVPATA